jgi:hypothetical protein
MGSKITSLVVGLVSNGPELGISGPKRKRESDGFIIMEGVGNTSLGGSARYWKRKAQSNSSLMGVQEVLG